MTDEFLWPIPQSNFECEWNSCYFGTSSQSFPQIFELQAEVLGRFLSFRFSHISHSLSLSLFLSHPKGVHVLFLYDLQSRTCEVIWENVDLWSSALSYSDSSGLLTVFGWGNHSNQNVDAYSDTGYLLLFLLKVHLNRFVLSCSFVSQLSSASL